jgi:uncharacterized protein YndB with AHSA1/START domain
VERETVMKNDDFAVDREKLEVRLSRVFDAPRERLFAAFTDPGQISKWWGPRGMTTVVDKFDFREGGIWRFVHRDSDGKEYAFNGVYKEIVEPERITDTFEFEPAAGHVMTETVVFERLPDGKTRVVGTARYANIEDLEGMVGSGMESGWSESYERLAELVEGNKAA